jgi:streptogramin lyase
MALDAEGTLFVAATEGSEILRVDPATGAAAFVGTSPTPSRLVVDAFGRITSWNTSGCFPCQETLSMLDPATGSLTTLATDSEVWANRTLAVVEPECADHLDNDHDGRVDLADPACVTPHGTRENRRPALCGVGAELAPLLALVARLGTRRARRRAR